MNEAFITKGIENSRYQKALRLVDQFETELMRKLENVSKATIEQRPDLFTADASPQGNKSSLRTEPLGHMRMDNEMDRVNPNGDNLIFQFAIEWTKPGVHGHGDLSDDTLCIALYKIKNLPRHQYEDVKRQTRADAKWDDIHYEDDLWNSSLGLFYIPVESGPDVTEALETLREHFYEFESAFGSAPPDDGN